MRIPPLGSQSPEQLPPKGSPLGAGRLYLKPDAERQTDRHLVCELHPGRAWLLIASIPQDCHHTRDFRRGVGPRFRAADGTWDVARCPSNLTVLRLPGGGTRERLFTVSLTCRIQSSCEVHTRVLALGLFRLGIELAWDRKFFSDRLAMTCDALWGCLSGRPDFAAFSTRLSAASNLRC